MCQDRVHTHGGEGEGGGPRPAGSWPHSFGGPRSTTPGDYFIFLLTTNLGIKRARILIGWRLED